MPSKPVQWTRRHFTQTLAATAAASGLPLKSLAYPQTERRTAFVGSEDHTICVFHVSGSKWSSHQAIPAISPAHLTLHPTLPILYAVHQTALWDNLPRGAVSAYSISAKGHLTLRHTQPLSLATTHPQSAAVTPDGTALAVISPTSGIFNILTIAPDGTLQPPAIIRKDLHPATQEIHSLTFLPDQKTLLTADRNRRPLHSLRIDGDLLIPVNITKANPAPRTPMILVPATIPTPISIAFRPA